MSGVGWLSGEEDERAGTPRPGAVSVVVPVHNGARYLAEALHSAVSQQPPPLEVIVVDDHSSDGSAAIAQSFGEPVKVVPAHGRGAAAHAIRASCRRGPLLAFLDADDRWTAGPWPTWAKPWCPSPGRVWPMAACGSSAAPISRPRYGDVWRLVPGPICVHPGYVPGPRHRFRVGGLA